MSEYALLVVVHRELVQEPGEGGREERREGRMSQQATLFVSPPSLPPSLPPYPPKVAFSLAAIAFNLSFTAWS